VNPPFTDGGVGSSNTSRRVLTRWVGEEPVERDEELSALAQPTSVNPIRRWMCHDHLLVNGYILG